MTKRITILLIVSALLVATGPIGASNEFVDFEVPDDYVGPAIDWIEPKEVQPGHVDLDWYDPKGQPVVQYAAQLGVDAETAFALLRWQRALNDRIAGFQHLDSYGLARVVNPSPTNGGGGLHCGFIKNNPSIWGTKATLRSVDVEWAVLSKPGGGTGASGGPWFYDNIGLGIHSGVAPDSTKWGVFERIEPIFNQLKQVSGTTTLYCMTSATGGSTVACTP